MGVWDRVKSWFGAPPDVESAPDPDTTAPPPIARDRDLEAAIAADPDAIAPYLVYADWLQEHEDPRGELIAIQVAIEQTSDGEQLQVLRAREAELVHRHGDYFLGSLTILPRWRRGFAHRIVVDHPAMLDRLVAELAIDHPVTRFLAEIRVVTEDPGLVERLRDHAPEGCAVVATTTGDLSQLEVEVYFLEDRGHVRVHGFVVSEILGLHATYRSLVRTIVTTEHGAHTWGFAAYEEPPLTGTFAVPRYLERIVVEVGLQLTLVFDDDSTETRWFEGRIVASAQMTRAPLVLHACDPITGPVFDATAVSIATAPTGPVLLDEEGVEGNSFGTVLPGVGVFLRDYDQLVTPVERTAIADTEPKTIGVYLQQSVGGANGAVAQVFRRAGGYGDVLGLVRLPGGTARHVEQLGELRACAFDPSGTQIAVVGIGPKLLVLFDVDSGSELLAFPLEELDPASAITVIWNESLHVACNRRAWRLDREARRLVTSSIPGAVGRLDAAIVQSYHPTPDRTAWLISLTTSILVGWCDRDGVPHTVRIADVEPDERSRERVAVLEDGRVLAIHNRIWLVDPASTTIRDIGAAGDYSAAPLVTREGDRLRLWSHGGGPWWLDL